MHLWVAINVLLRLTKAHTSILDNYLLPIHRQGYGEDEGTHGQKLMHVVKFLIYSFNSLRAVQSMRLNFDNDSLLNPYFVFAVTVFIFSGLSKMLGLNRCKFWHYLIGLCLNKQSISIILQSSASYNDL